MSDWKSKKEMELDRDREDELDAAIQLKRKGPSNPSASSDPLVQIEQLLKQSEPLIEQLNNLYNQYFSGAEQSPPIQLRKHLDENMAHLANLPKPTASLRFRASSLTSQYVTFRDRWDKKLKDIETGKFQRKMVPGGENRF